MKTLKAILLVLGIGFAAVSTSAALAQTDGLSDVRGNREALRMGLYPPDIIMKHQQRLGITDQQRREISKAVQKFQTEVADLQWTMQNDQQLLKVALAAYPIDANAALMQAEKVLKLESRFKKAHFKLLFTIKNALTQEQVNLLNRTIGERLGRQKP